MADRNDDLVDQSRSTIPRAGEGMKDARGLPGYLLIGVGVLALVVCLATDAQGRPTINP
jgi:hypothetical protein